MPATRPNVLLILQDQLRYDHVADAELCATPAQDRLREDGAWLANHYTPLGICSPARASILTGTYPHTNGVLNNLGGTDAFVEHLPHDPPTVAELLRAEGYRTGYAGKWHLGRDRLPDQYGFDVIAAIDRDLVTGERFRPYWERARDPRTAVRSRYPEPRGKFERRPFPIYSPEAVSEDIHPAVTVQQAATRLLTELAAGDEPFFLVASFLEPHWPYVLPKPWAAMYDPADIRPWANFGDDFTGKPRTLRAGLDHFGVADFTWQDWAPIIARSLGATSFIDDLVGRIDAALHDLEIADTTLVIHTTDHGDLCGSHGGQFNKGPLMYEETYHCPLVLRWPGAVEPGTGVEALTSHIDLVPTILEAAGAKTPEHLQGTSFLSLARGQTSDWREALMSEFHGDEFGLYSQRMVRYGDWKLIYNPNDISELYHLGEDPAELRNLAYEPEHIELRKDLEARLLDIMQSSGDPLRLWAVNTLG